jgi:predicted phage-related endonuclease
VIVDRYQPQLQWMMFVTGARKVALSVIMGAAEPIVEYIDRDDHYIDVMVRRATEFMECVWSLRPPFALPPPVASPPLAVKRYDLTGNNEWAANAVTWLTTRQARKDCESAEKTLKKMVPEDAAICFGHGIQINRDRAGRLAIREQT